MSLLCPCCLVYGVWEAGKTTGEYTAPISNVWYWQRGPQWTTLVCSGVWWQRSRGPWHKQWFSLQNILFNKQTKGKRQKLTSCFSYFLPISPVQYILSVQWHTSKNKVHYNFLTPSLLLLSVQNSIAETDTTGGYSDIEQKGTAFPLTSLKCSIPRINPDIFSQWAMRWQRPQHANSPSLANFTLLFELPWAFNGNRQHP